MSIYYNLIFGILSLEILLFTLISLPLPSKFRAPLLSLISKPFQSIQAQISIKCVLVFILILFLDAFNRSRSIDTQLKELNNSPHGGFIDRSEIQAKRFYAQRNLYLTGFTLFLTLITNRTYALVAELIEVKKTVRDGKLVDSKTDLKAELKAKDEEITALKLKAKKLSEEYDQL